MANQPSGVPVSAKRAGLPAIPGDVKRRLSPRDRRFIDAYMITGNIRTAMEIVDPSLDSHVAYQRGKSILDRLDDALDYVMAYNGLSDVHIVNKVLEGMDANRTEVATFRGEITDAKEFPDYQTRARYIELAARMKGYTRDRGVDKAAEVTDRVVVNINIGGSTITTEVDRRREIDVTPLEMGD